jgi:hypothetical protein
MSDERTDGEELATVAGVGIAAPFPLAVVSPATMARVGADSPTRAVVRMGSELGIPRHTVVTVRRRLVPRLAARADELVLLPLGGLAVAALAIQGFRIYRVVLGSVTILAMSLLPLRRSRPPQGIWR